MKLTADQEQRANDLYDDLIGEIVTIADAARELIYLRDEVERLKAAVPTTWLDPLLTGPEAVLGTRGGQWGCPDIEKLLQAIRKRMETPA